MASLDSAMKSYKSAPYAIKGISVSGYASPDGKEMINSELAENRSKSSAKYLSASLKKMKANVNTDSSFFTTSSTSEDWDGFQKLMQESDMQQKDMILRIVASNSDPEAREMEIKKMGKAYEEIAEGILPKLRRSRITVNAEKTGRSDEEINRLAASNPDSLSVEELLYAGALATDLNNKLSIYKSAERIYPQDWRTSNNVGMVMFMQNDVDGAMAQFNKADQLSANNPAVKNNLGAVYSRKGDRKKAAEMYAAAGSNPETNENMGILDIRNGNYGAAVGHYGSSNTFNAALAKLLNGDKDGAMSTLEASPDKDSAQGHYLMAVISARKGDASGVTAHLSKSVALDASMKKKAAEDREFIKWFNDSTFKGIVQ
jgi:tetratricopeptide (TPR) repeat protein